MQWSPKHGYSVESTALYGVEADAGHYGRWMCYDTFAADGDSLDELMSNCSGFTMDQDGGEGPEVHLDDLPTDLQTRVRDDILDQWKALQDDPDYQAAMADARAVDDAERWVDAKRSGDFD